MKITAKVISPLEKVLYTDKPSKFKSYKSSTALIGEKADFEVLYFTEEFAQNAYTVFDVFVQAKLYRDGKETDTSCVTVSKIDHMPSVYPGVQFEMPDNYISTAPGLYPDLLVPIDEKTPVSALPRIASSLWISIDTKNLEGGKYTAEISISNDTDETIVTVSHILKVIPVSLPEQQLTVTQWLHTDCIADYYHIDVFSEEYWTAAENLVRLSVDSGSKMIYTPLFTPPLDTNPGEERTTVQLVDVAETKEGYAFGFEKLRRWVEMCLRCGAEAFEMSHLFTQWGAFHAPKIMAGTKQIFGWDTDAAGKPYERFLSQFLPALCKEIRELGIADKTVFHISDEPELKHLESYRSASRIVHKYLKGFNVMDAMSHTAFYEEKLVDIPVPHIVYFDKFSKKSIKPCWVYYCGAQKKSMGRAFGMPSLRNRIIGSQFYAHKIDGFLHWGFNFYNTARSTRKINPYAVTDAGMKFPSGDSFMVYPAPNFAFYSSIRLEVFRQGIDDMRALWLCEKLCGREATEKVLSDLNGGQPLNINDTPADKEFTLKMRKIINLMIEKNAK